MRTENQQITEDAIVALSVHLLDIGKASGIAPWAWTNAFIRAAAFIIIGGGEKKTEDETQKQLYELINELNAVCMCYIKTTPIE